MEIRFTKMDGYKIFIFLSIIWLFLCIGIFFICPSDNITANNEWSERYKARLLDSQVKDKVHTQTHVDSQKKNGKMCNIFDQQQKTKDKHECVYMLSEPQVIICIHDVHKDIHISKSIRETGVYQAHVLSVFKLLLIEDPYLGVIDIGANIGQYSLVASAMGRPVVAVEARLMHVEMMHHSLLLNMHRSNFELLHNTISNDYEIRHLQLPDPTNQGHMHIVGEDEHRLELPDDEVSQVEAFVMDDLLEVITFRGAIMKIDLEGAEADAFYNYACDKLLKEIYIPFIFMEWMWHSHGDQLVLVDILHRHNYAPYSLDSTLLSYKAMDYWPPDVIWKHDTAIL